MARLALETAIPLLRPWAEKNPRVMYLAVFGSRVKGTDHGESDLDIALEVTPAPGDTDAMTTFTCERDRWRADIEILLGFSPVDLNPKQDVVRGLREGHIVVYERPEPELDFSNIIVVDDLDLFKPQTRQDDPEPPGLNGLAGHRRADFRLRLE